LATFAGFRGDHCGGLSSLKSAYASGDMKSPLAMLTLLWYYCLVCPFFFPHDDKRNSEARACARQLLDDNERVYPESALFLFFKSRLFRCEKNLAEAIKTVKQAITVSRNQLEIQLMCVYDLGWCHMLELNWKKALENILKLKRKSTWSLSYYCYLAALLHGINSDAKACNELLREIPRLVKKKKTNPTESYVSRKSASLMKLKMTRQAALLSMLEVFYLWNNINLCSEQVLRALINECEQNECEEELRGIKHLVLGGIYKCLDDTVKSLEHFRCAICLTQNDVTNDSHITPYAYFEMSLICSAFDSTKGKRYMEEAANFTGYDLEGRLRMRIHSKLSESEKRKESEAMMMMSKHDTTSMSSPDITREFST